MMSETDIAQIFPARGDVFRIRCGLRKLRAPETQQLLQSPSQQDVMLARQCDSPPVAQFGTLMSPTRRPTHVTPMKILPAPKRPAFTASMASPLPLPMLNFDVAKSPDDGKHCQGPMIGAAISSTPAQNTLPPSSLDILHDDCDNDDDYNEPSLPALSSSTLEGLMGQSPDESSPPLLGTGKRQREDDFPLHVFEETEHYQTFRADFADMLQGKMVEPPGPSREPNLRAALKNHSYVSAELLKRINDATEKDVKYRMTRADRSVLSQVVADKIIQETGDSSVVKGGLIEAWVKQINLLIPWESAETYYNYDKSTTKRSGCLSYKIENLKKKANKLAVAAGGEATSCRKPADASAISTVKSRKSHSSRGRSRSSHGRPAAELTTSVPFDSSCLQWLEASASPWNLVLEKWKATAKQRADMFEDLDNFEYFQKFPALRLPQGKELVSFTNHQQG